MIDGEESQVIGGGKLGVIRPVLIPSEIVSQAQRRSVEEDWRYLAAISRDRRTIEHLPLGLRGIVLGSGPKTDYWRSLGWQTLDIDPRVKPDFCVDANQMETVLARSAYDFVLAEYIRFDPSARQGVQAARLLNQTNAVLKLGGKLVVQSAHKENHPTTTLPDRREFALKMIRHGFNPYIVIYPLRKASGASFEQQVEYYCVKIAEGFDDRRAVGKVTAKLIG